MSEHEIAEAIDGFARAAVLALEAGGFDGVEIHGANGYLLDQFFTDYTNRRQDSWGGSVERRARLTIEVVRCVRAAIGESALLGVRISQSKVNDALHRWAQPDLTARTIFAGVADAGASYIHVTEADSLRPASPNGGSTLIQLAHRAAPGLPIIANGGLQEPARALTALERGASLIALGRGALANPDWPRRVGYGHKCWSSIRRCSLPTPISRRASRIAAAGRVSSPAENSSNPGVWRFFGNHGALNWRNTGVWPVGPASPPSVSRRSTRLCSSRWKARYFNRKYRLFRYRHGPGSHGRRAESGQWARQEDVPGVR